MKKRSIFQCFIALVLAMILSMSAFPITALANVELDSSFELYMIPNTHLDTSWQWPFQHTADNYLRVMYNTTVNALESNSDYKFTTSAKAHYEWIKDFYGEDNPIESQRFWERMKTLVANGQWDVSGGQVVEPDLNMPSGESLVRHTLYAQHFFEDEFGKGSKTGFVPDVFGFAGQFPQILYKAEMPYFVTSKVNWSETTGQGSTSDNYRLRSDGYRGRDSDIMNWRALDGETSVLSYLLYNDYNNTDTKGSVQSIFNQNWQDGMETGVKKAMAFYGGGDMGQGLQASTGGNSFRAVEEVNDSSVVTAKMSTVTEFFDDVAATEDLSDVRTWEGEMYLEYHRGTYTTWARMKKYNRDNEILAESSEKAATIGFYTGSTPTNGESKIDAGWNKILVNQMHDVLPGSALAYQYYVTFNNHELAANLFNGVRDNALSALAYRADTDVDGKPVFVYNELSWTRDGEVTVDLEYDADTLPDSVVIYDGETPIHPTKLVRDDENNKLTVTFMAAAVPAIGYKVFDVQDEDPAERTSSLKVDVFNLTVENDKVKMTINPDTGYISSLQHRVGDTWREAFAQNVGTEGAELHVYKDTEVRPPQNFDQWELNRSEIDKEPDWVVDGAPKSIEVVENTPEKITVRVIKEWNGSAIAQDMTLYENSDRVDVRLVADWYQTKRLLKVSFPIMADIDEATYETSYGAVRRPTDRLNPFQYARFEVPGHKWLDVTDESGEYGVSILNDAKYGFDSLRRTLGGTTFVRSRITVARTPRAQAWAPSGPGNSHSSVWTPYVPYVIDSRTHDFNYSIYPHSGSWEDSETVNKAQELNYPMKAFEAAKNSSDGFGSSESFASSDTSNVIISALKNQTDNLDDQNTVIVRMYESSGRDTDNVTISLPGNIISAKEVNLLEHDYDRSKALAINDNKITFNIGKFEILTIEAKLAPVELDALELPQESVELTFDQRATSSKTSRSQFFIDGEGTNANPGMSMPEIKWPEDGIEYQGINFTMGPKDDNNVVSGNGTTIDVEPENNYSKVYIAGFATGGEAVDGDFTVTYKDGSTTSKSIKFNDWRTDLSGWDREDWMDSKPYVYDSIVHFNNHYHQTHGTTATGGQSNYTAIMMATDNYMFAYDIDIDDTKTVESITLPDKTNIKIAAITLADPVEGYGNMHDSSKQVDPPVEPDPDAPQNVKATYEPGTDYNDVTITWDKADNAVRYQIYYSSEPDFVPSESNLLAEQGGLSYTHVSPAILGANAIDGKRELYYKVISIGKASGESAASAPSNGIAPRYIDYALNIANNRVSASGRTNANESWEKPFNGDLSSKWCQTGVNANSPAWLLVDLTGENGRTVELERFMLYHCGAGGEQASANTSDFRIEYSADSTNGSDGTWTDAVNVTNNQSSITTHNLSGNINARWVRLWVTKPEYTTWSNAVRLYGFKMMGENPGFVTPDPVSTANNPAIDMTVESSDEVKLTASYDYYNESGLKTEGDTVFKWYWKFTDVYGDVYALISGANSAELMQPLDTVQFVEAYRCDITIYDSDGTEGETVTIEVDSPVSTADNTKIVPTTIGGDQMQFTATYDFYNSLNDTAPNAITEGDTQFAWYKFVDSEYVIIEGETSKTLTQTYDEVRETEAYKCDITVYNSNGTQGKTVAAEVDTYINVLLGADVVEETSTNNSAKNMVDGNYGTKWDVITATESPGPCPHWAVLDMGSVKSFTSLKVFHANSYPSQDYDRDPRIATYDFDLMYSVDGENWITKEFRANTDPISTVEFGELVEARYVKIYVITPNNGGDTWDTNYKAIRILQVEALISITDVLSSSPPVTLYDGDEQLPSLDSAKGKAVDVKVNVENVPEGKINVIAATYSSSGALLNAKLETVNVDESGIIDCTIPGFAVSAQTDQMKVFFWTADTQVPVIDAALVH